MNVDYYVSTGEQSSRDFTKIGTVRDRGGGDLCAKNRKEPLMHAAIVLIKNPTSCLLLG